jgi:hypothetical protein
VNGRLARLADLAFDGHMLAGWVVLKHRLPRGTPDPGRRPPQASRLGRVIVDKP